MNTLKLKIKELSEEQVSLKPQRKAVHFQGERKLSASQAAAEHMYNRANLRHLFAAYAILRGKTPLPLLKMTEDPLNSWTKREEERRIKIAIAQYEPEFKERKAAWEKRQAEWEASQSVSTEGGAAVIPS